MKLDYMYSGSESPNQYYLLGHLQVPKVPNFKIREVKKIIFTSEVLLTVTHLENALVPELHSSSQIINNVLLLKI